MFSSQAFCSVYCNTPKTITSALKTFFAPHSTGRQLCVILIWHLWHQGTEIKVASTCGPAVSHLKKMLLGSSNNLILDNDSCLETSSTCRAAVPWTPAKTNSPKHNWKSHLRRSKSLIAKGRQANQLPRKSPSCTLTDGALLGKK